MITTANNRRGRVGAMLADLKMPGAQEVIDGILAQADSGATTAGEAIEQLLGAQIVLRNNRRLETAMRSSRLPVVKHVLGDEVMAAALIERKSNQCRRSTNQEALGRLPSPLEGAGSFASDHLGT